MIDSVIEMFLFSLMTVIYFIADKQYRLNSARVEHGLRSARGRPVER